MKLCVKEYKCVNFHQIIEGQDMKSLRCGSGEIQASWEEPMKVVTRNVLLIGHEVEQH